MCSANNYSEEEYPSRQLPIPQDYIDNLQSRLIRVKKGILSPTLEMILKTYYHLPARQVPIPSPAVQPDDMMGRHRDGGHSPLERPRASHEEEEVIADGTSSTDKGETLFLKPRSGWTTRHHKSPLAISNWRYFGNIKGQQRRTQIGGETTPFKQTSRKTRKQ